MLVQCPTCKGTGKQTISSKLYTEKGWIDTPAVKIKCINCDGLGVKDADVLAAEQAAWDEFWCKCKNSPDSYYVPDRANDECSKHHYRCVVCHKVTQVG